MLRKSSITFCLLLMLVVPSFVNASSKDAPVSEHAHAPSKYVCIAPSACEWLAEILLGSENKSSDKSSTLDQIVAVVEHTRYPSDLSGKLRVGTLNKVNIESIFKLQPDLVVATKDGNDPDQIKKLKKLGLRVHVMDHIGVDNFPDVIGKLAAAIHAENVLSLQQKWKAAVAGINKSNHHGCVYVVVDTSVLMVAGAKSFYTKALELVGLKNCEQSKLTLYPRRNKEVILKHNPVALVVMSMGDVKINNDKKIFKDILHVEVAADDFARVSFRFLDTLKNIVNKINL